MDNDDNGSVQYDEFMEGLREVPDFEVALESIGVRKNDVQEVFDAIDLDGSGCVSCDEFVRYMTMMQDTASFKILRFIKQFMDKMQKQLEQNFQATKSEIIRGTREEVEQINHLEQIELRQKEEVAQ